uniref:hypothetical protein n=1 Tax=Paractinoplanes polyasparticus TaxID=2856853 RepID=UPI0021083650|nr:hypothetical protein [Actinoplanes polyasparticus]
MSFTPPAAGALPASRIDRRVGPPPKCSTNVTCPAIFQLADGNFALIGTHHTDTLQPQLPPDAGVADYERIIVVPKAVMLGATKVLVLALAGTLMGSVVAALLLALTHAGQASLSNWSHLGLPSKARV